MLSPNSTPKDATKRAAEHQYHEHPGSKFDGVPAISQQWY